MNWRPDAAKWSVAQCLDHLLAANRLMMAAGQRALDDTQPRDDLAADAGLPGLFGTDADSLAGAAGHAQVHGFAAGPPAASDIAADIVERFVARTARW